MWNKFSVLVAIVSIFIFSFTKWDSVAQRTAIRVAMLPVISGITYELIRWLGKSQGNFAKIIAAARITIAKIDYKGSLMIHKLK